MRKKASARRYRETPERWSDHENKTISYELEFNGVAMKPGTQFKVKGEHTIYIFTCLVHHIDKDLTWVECMQDKGGFYSFYPSRISKVITPKRSYRRKTNV